eukprot:CAMPEP_0172485008 /NCGR_PEP_ID=MMETSP1066-20121228/12732_1 /TAXON_ID=671091 /ORGANISM="Coscinodiscus wailesii, Strain CCMP2513" /LENGTH=144 /DNA_ID=CAMNT_0013249893 /DNA_START=256 /DNA_END=690 /DNA_ORIENTATION=-
MADISPACDLITHIPPIDSSNETDVTANHDDPIEKTSAEFDVSVHLQSNTKATNENNTPDCSQLDSTLLTVPLLPPKDYMSPGPSSQSLWQCLDKGRKEQAKEEPYNTKDPAHDTTRYTPCYTIMCHDLPVHKLRPFFYIFMVL